VFLLWLAKICRLLVGVGCQVLVSLLIVMWDLPDSQLTITPFIRSWVGEPYVEKRRTTISTMCETYIP
jgi:hypothetical protein